METIAWYLRGRADHQDRTPTKRAPKVPDHELYAADGLARPDVQAYWDGWNGGVLDAANAVFRQHRRGLDVPAKVRVWDNGGVTFDRYTVIIGQDAYVMGRTGNHPQGVCQYAGRASQVKPEGTSVAVADLPEAVQRTIATLQQEGV